MAESLRQPEGAVRVRRRYRRHWGLRLAPPETPRAGALERRWRVPLIVALAATIPAFYAGLVQAAPHVLARLAYVVAAVIVAASLGLTARLTHHPREHLRANPLDAGLIAGLLAAAVLPASQDHPLVLSLRLVVALATMVRMLWALQHLVTRSGVAYLLLIAFVVLLLCGAGYWWLEPTTPTLAEGLWLAFVTAATVGYGDVVPTTPASKIFSVFVVLLGFGVIVLATAAIATTWVETEERRIEREILHELHAQIAALREEIQALREWRAGGRAD
jgi:voltage-gated potassium channel